MRSVRLLSACVVALVVAAPAQGATVVGSETGCESPPCVVDVTVTDRAGDRNDLSFEVDGNALVVRDAATPLRALRGCEKREDGSVRCAFSRPVEQVQVEAGEQDDVVRTPPWAATLWLRLDEGNDRFEGWGRVDEAAGGPGDDTLVKDGAGRARMKGGPGDDVVTGGLGRDRLLGETGRDRISGGPGDDVLDPVDNEDEEEFEKVEVPAADVVDGGPGRDLVAYQRARLPVAVDLLAPGVAGAPGEGDALSGVEDVAGGRGGDRLSGDDGENRILGDFGADVLSGRGGPDLLDGGVDSGETYRFTPDRLDGGSGPDTLRTQSSARFTGGPGNDLITGGLRREASSAVCDGGFDVVRVRGRVMTIDPSCERWGLRFAPFGTSEYSLFPHPRVRRGAVSLRLPCENTPRPGRCTLRLKVSTTSGRRLGSARGRTPDGSSRLLVARLRGPLPARLRVVVVTSREGSARGGGVIVATR